MPAEAERTNDTKGTIMNLLLVPIAIAATVVTYGVSYHVLNKLGVFGSPRLIAGCVALLSGLSLLSPGNGVVTLILLPYAALGLSLLLLPLLRWLDRSGCWRKLQRLWEDEPPAPPPQQLNRTGPPGQNKNHTARKFREAPPTEE
jgi:hypothetical protein